MRKIFASAALVSVVGALLFGGAFAWRTSDSARGAALVGENGFEISYQPVCDGVADSYLDDAEPTDAAVDLAAVACHTIIGPNGSNTEVGRGAGKNEGDFKLAVVGGEVQNPPSPRRNERLLGERLFGKRSLAFAGRSHPARGRGRQVRRVRQRERRRPGRLPG